VSESLRNPQLEPASHCYVVLQDHGEDDGGWGPAAVMLPWMQMPAPFVYTGSDERILELAGAVVRLLAQETGKPTLLAKFVAREDVLFVGGSS
jgi:hypothetical protein